MRVEVPIVCVPKLTPEASPSSLLSHRARMMVKPPRFRQQMLVWSCLAVLSGVQGISQTSTQHPEHSPQAGQSPADPHAAHKAATEKHEPAGHHHSIANMSGANHKRMNHGALNAAGIFLTGQSSGTGYQPSAWPMPMLMNRIGDWHLMWMGQAYLISTQQSGPRGGDKIYSSNWGMLGAVRRLGQGSMMLRTMVSLDPLTVTNRQYPLLFQTGETAYGRPIVDGQHPHELIMELSAQYAHPMGQCGVVNVYYAPVGDVALGPVAYPHRASAMELPQATLSHHWQDSTHIANNVLTTGLSYGPIRVEASGFYGREPLENRWNLDWGGMDSWSGRVSVFPAPRWMAQVSAGRLKRPEQTHPDDIVRATASVQYVVPRAAGTSWATSLIWARNYKTIERHASHAVTAETVVPIGRKNFVTGRFEWSQRDELFNNDPDLHEHIEHETGKHAFPVAAYTAGYTRDVEWVRNLQTGLGTNVTAYAPDSALKPFYGNRPWAINFYVRFRLRAGE
jgi:hypothetical protein